MVLLRIEPPEINAWIMWHFYPWHKHEPVYDTALLIVWINGTHRVRRCFDVSLGFARENDETRRKDSIEQIEWEGPCLPSALRLDGTENIPYRRTTLQVVLEVQSLNLQNCSAVGCELSLLPPCAGANECVWCSCALRKWIMPWPQRHKASHKLIKSGDCLEMPSGRSPRHEKPTSILISPRSRREDQPQP